MSGPPIPKPIRQKKERKPLKRSIIPIRRSSTPIKRHIDRAVFDKELLNHIWDGHWPFPFSYSINGVPQSGIFPWEYHHILGRGRGDKMYSSPYNALPVTRAVHERGWINWPTAQALFLDMARRRVDQAIAHGLYEPTDNDAAFLAYANEKLLSFMRE